ncbi:hypothetical protein [Serratia marcescens]|uniref:hypothetical protein n=1 Tax=Serratia marcescens TaxID=615 RepID=UPI001F14E3FC|nr:hypothetical protein [Serratia marcescens]MDP8728343.1 hypothetical protein [Serratia marcescens]
MKLIYVTMTDMANRYGYSLNAIKKWKSEGLPFDEEKGKIPEKKGTEWIIENKLNPLRAVSVKEEMDKERLREQRCKADLAQMEVALKAGALIEVDYVQAALNKYLTSFKDTMRGIARTETVGILESANDVKSLKAKLTEVINSKLNEIGDLILNEDMLEDVEEPEFEIGERPVADLNDDAEDNEDDNEED